MQAKMVDFASGRIAKSLNKIDKNDVRNVILKLRKQERVSQKDFSMVNSSEDYCEMLKKEWPDLRNKQKEIQQENEQHISNTGGS